MTVHDDKISDKRRRLFKALSAAPVVATLQPGSAFANASAFQCSKNIRDNLTLRPGPVELGSINTEPFLYNRLTYWVFDHSSRVKRSDQSGYRGLHGTGTEAYLGGSGLKVVNMDPDNSSAGPFMLMNGKELQTLFASNKPKVKAILDGNRLKIKNQWGNVCLEANGAEAGFAVIGYAREVGGVQDRDFHPVGVYPEVQVPAKKGAHHGEHQGITATCMNSMIGASQYPYTQG